MKRALATAAATLLAAACTGPQVDFCGKSCAGAAADCGPGYFCDATSNSCQNNEKSCPPQTLGGTGGGTTGGTGGTGGRSSTGGTGGSSSGGSPDGGVPYVNMPCTPPSGSAIDPCLADDAGLACNPNQTFSANICTLPEEYEECVIGVGCAAQVPATPALICQAISFTDGTSENECTFNCNVTADCPNSDDTCQDTLCYSDFCGPGSLADGGSVNPGGYYAPCDSVGTNDGTCLPYGTDYGLCEENGTLQANQKGCGNRPVGGGTGTLCAASTVCITADATGNSFCAPICASETPPTGPSCSGATVCESDGIFGDCETTCASTATCPAGLTCQGLPSGTCLP